MALPQSSYFEKVRLLEAWHGMALAWPWHAHFEKVRLLEAWHGVACLALASCAQHPRSEAIRNLSWHSLRTASAHHARSLFRESEAIGSLARHGLGLALACVALACVAFGLPCLAHFEKVRLLEAWHGVACLALACLYFCLGLSSVMLLCWEYGHQTFSMHGYVGDGFRRG
ncbi:unnamed protein product [Prunus brigantina]